MSRRCLPDQPTEGGRIDILDQEKIWSSGIITSVRHLTESAIVEVRYDGWDSSSWNERLSSSSERLAPIYTYTARLRCLVRLLQRKSSSKYRGGNSHLSNLWPCTIHIRMADKEDPTALQNLSIENKIFVEPSRPDLLPRYVQKDWMNGGVWVENENVALWMTTMDLKEIWGKNKDFTMAYEHLENDPSIPGNLNENIFEEGTKVKKKFRITDSGENKLVDLHGWEDALVDLKSLDKIDVKKKPASADSVSSTSTSLSGNSKRAVTHASEAKVEGRQRSSDRISYRQNNITDYASAAEGNRRSARSRSSKPSYYDDASPDTSMMVANGRSGTKSHTSKLKNISKKPEPGEAYALRNAVEIKDSNYPGYAITRSSTTGKWIASFDIRGNTVHVGKFPTQSQAKEAIDNARAEYQNSGNDGGKSTMARPKKMTLNELKVAKEKDISAITVEKAVAIAYRDGVLSDTGFSMHNWTLEVVKEKDKIKEKDKAEVQRQFLELKKRRREEKSTPLSSNRSRAKVT